MSLSNWKRVDTDSTEKEKYSMHQHRGDLRYESITNKYR